MEKDTNPRIEDNSIPKKKVENASPENNTTQKEQKSPEVPINELPDREPDGNPKNPNAERTTDSPKDEEILNEQEENRKKEKTPLMDELFL